MTPRSSVLWERAMMKPLKTKKKATPAAPAKNTGAGAEAKYCDSLMMMLVWNKTTSNAAIPR